MATPKRTGTFSNDHPLAEAARQWLAALERCVRALDYEAACALFDPDVQAFGTYAAVVDGREALRREQWQHVWPTIGGFTFRLAEVRCAGSEGLLGVIAPWDSVGRHPDGTTYPRPGRATLILARSEGRWVALHSHFSLAPSTR
ncbi:MAG TPA: nuclear transport factor 2 family protein [bacterium]|nr:nuclear transport factor 2 family protein [bacterium]